jgi:REP element-mobilizing transposase RayT
MAKQLEFSGIKGHGGKRKRAGRKNNSGTVNHMEREKVDFKKLVHLTQKLKPIRFKLRNHEFLKEFKQACKRVQSFGLHVIHFAIQNNHIHFILEAKDNQALSNGMRSLGCKIAKLINRRVGTKGPVFHGRYHLHVLKKPTEMRNALRYVLLNQANHSKLIPYADEFSTAKYFTEFRHLLKENIGPLLKDHRTLELPEFLKSPTSWLCKSGWMRALG